MPGAAAGRIIPQPGGDCKWGVKRFTRLLATVLHTETEIRIELSPVSLIILI